MVVYTCPRLCTQLLFCFFFPNKWVMLTEREKKNLTVFTPWIPLYSRCIGFFPTPSNSDVECLELASDHRGYGFSPTRLLPPRCQSQVVYTPCPINMFWDSFTNAEQCYFICILVIKFIFVYQSPTNEDMLFRKC